MKVLKMKVLNLIKRYWLFILLGFLATLLAGIWILKPFSQNQPEPPLSPSLSILPLPQIEGQSVSRTTTVIFNDFSFPEKAIVYQGQKNELSLERAIEIAKKLGFKNKPQITQDADQKKVFNWKQEGEYLSINPDPLEIVYDQDPALIPFPQEGVLPSPSAAQKILEQTLTELNLKPAYPLQSQREQYLALLGPTISPIELQKADLIMANSTPILKEILLLGQNPKVPLVLLMVNKNDQLTQFEYHLPFISFKPQQEYPLKTNQEIKQKLSQEGKIVFFDVKDETDKENRPVEINFNQASLAYLQPTTEDNLIQPIFVLGGQATLGEGQKVEVIIYLPAINSRYLKGPLPKPIEIENPQEHFGF